MGWIAAAIAAAGAIGGGILQSNAASDAQSASAAGSAAAMAEQRREYDLNAARQQPWLTTGASALNRLANIYGLDTFTFNQPGGAAGTAGATGPTANDQQALAQIRSGLAAWGNQYPGAADSIISLIDSGAPLSQVAGALQSARATTTNPANTAILDPIIAQAQSAAAQSGAGVTGTFAPGTSGTVAAGQPGGAPDYSAFFASPDYQYRLRQSLGAETAQQAKLGLLDSGDTRKGILARAGDLASGEFNTYANRLATLAGIGQTTASNLGTQGSTYAANIGNLQQNAANNQASSYLASGQNYANLTNQLAGIGQSAFNTYQAANAPTYVNAGSLPNNANVVNSAFQLPPVSIPRNAPAWA
jgi:hypothetical protein